MDGLTAEERAAIEAFPKERIQRIPQGVYATGQMAWDPHTGTIRYKDPTEAKREFSGRGRKPDPKVMERRERVAALARAGRTGQQIADELGIPLQMVYRDCQVVGVSLSREAAARHRHSPDVQAMREKIRAAFDGERTAEEIGRIVGAPRRTVWDHLDALGLKAPPAKPGPPPDAAIEARRAKIPGLIDEGLSGPEIAERLGITRATLGNDCKVLGVTIPRRRRKNTGTDRAAGRKASTAERARSKVRDRRRFKTTPVPTGEAFKQAPADATGTMFPSRVQDVGEAAVLKDGAMNSKIGGDVLVGRLEGAKIVTLTLEERATCPRSCDLWSRCYGNGMQYSVRWRHGPELIEKLAEEIADLCAEYERVLVRLHVLGDFWSVEYVQAWEALLDAHTKLHVFGFTAWGADTEIGREVAAVRAANPDRFMIRHSGRCAPWGSFTIDFPTERKQLGDAIVCPEQRAAMNGTDEGRHCGSCGVCWASDRPIVFVEH